MFCGKKTSFQDHRKLIKLTAATFDYFLTKNESLNSINDDGHN